MDADTITACPVSVTETPSPRHQIMYDPMYDSLFEPQLHVASERETSGGNSSFQYDDTATTPWMDVRLSPNTFSRSQHHVKTVIASVLYFVFAIYYK